MQDVVFQNHRLPLRRQRLQPLGRGQLRECPVCRYEDRDAGSPLVGLELLRHPRSHQHRRGDVEGPGVNEDAGDVEAERRAVLGGGQIEIGRDNEGIDGEDAEIVRDGGDLGEDGGVGSGGENGDGAVRGEGEVDGAVRVEGSAGGLEEGGDEVAGGGEVAEVGPGEVLEEDVEAEDVG